MTNYPNSLKARQKYFDKTVHHLASMKRQAKNNGSPVYVAPNGRKCAIGVHIPDGHMAQAHPGFVRSLIGLWPDLDGVAVPKGTAGHLLAGMLQSAHDNEDNWEPNRFNGYNHLQWVAHECGLNDDTVREYL